MRKFFLYLNENKLFLLLLLLSILFWIHIPFLQFQGEGFYYFEKDVAVIRSLFPPHYDMFARIFFNSVVYIFVDQTYLYMSFLFIYMILVDILIYLLVKFLLTKTYAFLTTFLLSFSFIGKFDMFAGGGYQYFIQRVVQLPFLVFSFLFLVRYLDEEYNIRFLVISLFLFFIAIWFGFFGTWFLPIFIIYPVVKYFIEGNKSKSRTLNTILIPCLYTLINFFLITGSTYAKSEELITSLLFDRTEYVVTGLTQQLGVMTLPIGLYGYLKQFIQNQMLNEKAYLLELMVAMIYLVSLVYLIRLGKLVKILAVSSFFTLIVMLFLNIYKNSAASLNSLESSRYFYYPYIFFSVYWGIILGSLWLSNKKIKKIVVMLIIIYFGNNFYHLQRNQSLNRWRHVANSETINFLKKNQAELKANSSFVYLPSHLGAYGASFAYRYYSHPLGHFTTEDLEPVDFEKLVKLNAKPANLYTLHFDPHKQVVIDTTQDSRGKFLRFLNK